MSTAALTKALALAELGVAVFPCRPDKSPYTADGFYSGTIDPEAIQGMWALNPEALVVYWTGQSGLDVLDIDVHGSVNGFETLNHLGVHEPDAIDYESSISYNTPSGGQHHITRATQALKPAGNYLKLEGIDRRSGGSYAIWYGDAPTPEAWATMPTTRAWFSQGAKGASSTSASTGVSTDVLAWIEALSDGDSDPVLLVPCLHRDDLKTPINDIVRDAVYYPEKPGHKAALEFVTNSYLNSTVSSIDSAERPAKVVDLIKHFLSIHQGELAEFSGGFEWAQSMAEREAAFIAAIEPGASTWAEVDFGDVLSGDFEEAQPTALQREDGQFMLYPGCVNDIHGESESGKSWVALAAAQQMVRSKQHVRYLDFESSRGTVVGRMLRLGTAPELLREFFHYYRPEVRPSATEFSKADYIVLLGKESALTVIDGVTEAMSQSGLNPESNFDTPIWLNEVPKMLAKETGAAVLLIDHVPKSEGGRGRFAFGAQHKLAAIDGASYLIEVTEGISPGKVGELLLRVGKDRPGSVRRASGTWRGSDRTQASAVVVLDSTHPDHSVISVKSWEVSTTITASVMKEEKRVDMMVKAFETYRHFSSASRFQTVLKDEYQVTVTREQVADYWRDLEGLGVISVEWAEAKGKGNKAVFIKDTRPKPF